MPPAIYTRNPQTAGRIVDGLAFIITPDDNKLHTLNATATYLWQLADPGVTLDRAADQLCERYQVTRDTARADADTCFRDLVQRQVLLVDPPDS